MQHLLQRGQQTGRLALQPGQGHPGPDLQVRARAPQLLQLGHGLQRHHDLGVKGAVRQLQTQVGATGEHRGAGVHGEQVERVGQGRGAVERTAGGDHGGARSSGGLDGCVGRGGRQGVVRRRSTRRTGGRGVTLAGRGTQASTGPSDRRVPRAPAQVAFDHVGVDAVRAALRRVVVPGEHAHHESRRAVPALRAGALDHGLLHGVQLAVGTGHALDGDDVVADDRAHGHQAAVDRAVHVLPGRAPGHDDHGAGAAVAVAATLLGPDQAVSPNRTQQRGRRRQLRHGEVPPVHPEYQRHVSGHAAGYPGAGDGHGAPGRQHPPRTARPSGSRSPPPTPSPTRAADGARSSGRRGPSPDAA